VSRPELVQLVVYLAIIALVIVRLMRPQRMRASRLWIGPAAIVALSVFVIWVSYEAHAAVWAIALAVVAGLILGVPFGLVRGRHTDVRTTENPHVLLVQPSTAPVLIWFAAFAVRFLIRALFPNVGPTGLALSDGFLAFALASVIAARYVIAQKFKAQHAI
jgi:energy-coupling factor transporter transmembrane protein EcfT